MSIAFWVRRFFVVFFVAFALISLAQIFRGHPFNYAITQGALWGAISAFIFTGTRIYRSRQGQHCAMCADTPEMQNNQSNTSA